ncbi:MAG: ATP-binding cassette domain-containing protein, partial [Alphaproteobacteria bacterium]
MTSEAVPSSEPPVLAEASGIDVSFATTQVLSNVAIRVRQGEIVTLSGPNGSGKTTL